MCMSNALHSFELSCTRLKTSFTYTTFRGFNQHLLIQLNKSLTNMYLYNYVRLLPTYTNTALRGFEQHFRTV